MKRLLCHALILLITLSMLISSSGVALAESETDDGQNNEQDKQNSEIVQEDHSAESTLNTVSSPEGLIFDTSNGVITDYMGYGKTLNIPSKINGVSVVGISSIAFRDSCPNLTKMTIPASIKGIGGLDHDSFKGCINLTTINVSSRNPNYSSSDGILLNKKKTKLYRCPKGKTGSVTVPSSVTTIGSFAFFECTKFTSISIPSSVKTIGSYTFYGCKNLKNITLPSSITTLGQNSIFFGCTSLEKVSLPNSITSIGSNMFTECTSLKKIDLPTNLTSIEHKAFFNCTGLKSITLPGTITFMDTSAFRNCTGLEEVIIQNGVDYLSPAAFYNCDSLESIVIPNNTDISQANLFDNTFYDCDGIKDVTIEYGISYIGGGAFNSCDSLKTAFIPSSVRSIGPSAFICCPQLETVYMLGTNVNLMTWGGEAAGDLYAFSDTSTNLTIYNVDGFTGEKYGLNFVALRVVDEVIDGKLKRTIYYPDDTLMLIESYQGDNVDSGMYQIHYYKGQSACVYYEEYTTDGKLARLVECHSDGSDKKVNYYDLESGIRTSYMIYSSDGTRTHYVECHSSGKTKKVNYFSTSTGKRTKYKVYSSNGILKNMIICHSNGKAKKNNYYNSSGVRYAYKTYRSNGTLSCYVTCKSNGRPRKATYYNEQGEKIKVKYY